MIRAQKSLSSITGVTTDKPVSAGNGYYVPAPKHCFVASRRETATSNYYDVLQVDEEEQVYSSFRIISSPALTHQTGCDLLLPQTLSLKGQAIFRQAVMELKGTMGWVHHALRLDRRPRGTVRHAGVSCIPVLCGAPHMQGSTSHSLSAP